MLESETQSGSKAVGDGMDRYRRALGEVRAAIADGCRTPGPPTIFDYISAGMPLWMAEAAAKSALPAINRTAADEEAQWRFLRSFANVADQISFPAPRGSWGY